MFKVTLTVISAIIVGAAALAGVARYTEHAFGLVPVTPYEADVNKSGQVNAIDLQQVAAKFLQPVPTATPSLTTATRLVMRDSSGVQRIVDTATGETIQTIGLVSDIHASCDGHYIAFVQESGAGSDEVQVRSTEDGSILASESVPAGTVHGQDCVHYAARRSDARTAIGRRGNRDRGRR